MQTTAFSLFLLLSALTAAGFSYAAQSGRWVGEYPVAGANRARKWMVVGFAVAMVLFLVLTLPGVPYADEDRQPDRIVHVSAKQFAFDLSDTPIETGDSAPAAYAMKSVKAGELIEFRVTSADVTHGFGIYTSDGKILTQTQAMPGYVNRLRHTFEEPGGYPVFCMEYCGVGHHAMRATITVTE